MTEIKITRRATIDADYNHYEFVVPYDTEKDNGKDIIKDIEKMVVFARKEVAKRKAKEPKEPKKEAKKHKVPDGYKEVGKTEDIKIADLQSGDKANISIKLVKPIDPEKDIKAFISKTDGSAGKRCKVLVKDSSGTIPLTLFDEQIDLVQEIKENAWFTIQNGYVKEYQGKLELVVGRYGKIESVYNG